MTAKPEIVSSTEPDAPIEAAAAAAAATETQDQLSLEQELDEEEEEFRRLRRDLPGVKGSSAAGIISISVGKQPTKNEFFRTHREFRPIVSIVNVEIGMEKHYFAVTPGMIEPLKSIGITVSDHVLYLTVTSRGAIRIIPVLTADANGDRNDWSDTKEKALIRAIDEWVRIYSDLENHCYKAYPAPEGRYGDPQFPELKEAKIFRLAFRDKGRLIDNTEHSLFKKWAARDAD